jgi:phosphonate transport system permease protein
MSSGTLPSRLRPTKPRSGWKIALSLVVIAGITVWAAIAVGVDVGYLVRNAGNASSTLIKLTQPDYWFFPETVTALLQTLEMAVIATAIGSAVSLPLAFLASRATNPSGTVRGIVRFVLNIVRAVPDLLYAAVLVTIVGTGALSGIMALVLFNVGIIVKLVSESLDSIDRGPQEAALATGATWFKADRSAVLPEILPSYASQVIYTLELNVRASTVIGIVGAGGLGILIDKVRTFYRYHDLSLIILEILVVVVVLELISSALRRRLTR